MRHLFLIFLMALLPLRGWVSDAMATGMAAGQVQQMQIAIKIIATNAHAASEEADFEHEISVPEAAQTLADCAGHGSEENAHAGNSHCDSCSACQACHTVALSHSAPILSSVFHAFALPHAAADQFASAETALRQKPPIS